MLPRSRRGKQSHRCGMSSDRGGGIPFQGEQLVAAVQVPGARGDALQGGP